MVILRNRTGDGHSLGVNPSPNHSGDGKGAGGVGGAGTAVQSVSGVQPVTMVAVSGGASGQVAVPEVSEWLDAQAPRGTRIDSVVDRGVEVAEKIQGIGSNNGEGNPQGVSMSDEQAGVEGGEGGVVETEGVAVPAYREATGDALTSGKALLAIRQKLNSGSYPMAGLIVNGETKRISTGVFAVDGVAGVNVDGSAGLPVGGVNIFVGAESSGKTTTAARTIGEAQQLCSRCYRPAQELEPVIAEEKEGVTYVLEGRCDCFAKGIWRPTFLTTQKADERQRLIAQWTANSYRPFVVAYIDVEGTVDWNWFERFCYPNLIQYVRPATGEDAIDALKVLAMSGEVDMVVLDSVAMLEPNVELLAETEKQTQGLQARLINKLVRVTTAAQNRAAQVGRPVTFIWMQQWRMKIGVMFGDPRTMPGGEGQKYIASTILSFSSSEKVKIPDPRYADFPQDEQPTLLKEQTMSVEGIKNKSAAPSRKDSYVMRLSPLDGFEVGQVDDWKDMWRLFYGPNGIVTATDAKDHKYVVKTHLQTVPCRVLDDAVAWIQRNRREAEVALRRNMIAVQMRTDSAKPKKEKPEKGKK